MTRRHQKAPVHCPCSRLATHYGAPRKPLLLSKQLHQRHMRVTLVVKSMADQVIAFHSSHNFKALRGLVAIR